MLSYLKLIYYLLRPNTILVRRTSNGLGDNILLSAILPTLRKKHPRHRIVVETPFPELFENNPYVNWVTDKHFKTTKRHIVPRYRVEKDTRTSFIEQMMRYVATQETGSPRLYLTDAEIESMKARFPQPYITICPAGKTKFSSNRKEWGLERFQELRNLMSDQQFIQIGLPSDPLLENVIDARGLTIRESAALIHSSMFFLGLEGGFMHISRAVGRRSVVIFGGYIHPQTSGYIENINLYSPVDCSPCYHSHAPHEFCDSMKCMKAITPEMVYGQINTQMLGDGNEN